MRLITSEPKTAWGLRSVSTARTLPEARSTSCAAMVVVPRSMAMPRPDLPAMSVPTLTASAGADSVRMGHPARTAAPSERISMRHWAHSRTSGDSACAWQARRQPAASWPGVKAAVSASVTGSEPESTRTPQPPHSPIPPQGNSTPCAARPATSVEPRGTSISTARGSRRMRTRSVSVRSCVIGLPRWSRRNSRGWSRRVGRQENQPRPTGR